MSCPTCKSTEIYVLGTTTSTMDSGWLKCYCCGQVFRVYKGYKDDSKNSKNLK